jgi:uncharacterized protein (TIGR03083 family)
MTRPGSRTELDALAAEGKTLAAFLRGLATEDWSKPSRCPPMDVREIVVHLSEQMDGLIEVSAQPFIDSEPQKDRLTWWNYDIEEDQAETLRFVQKAAAGYPAGPLVADFQGALERAIEALGPRLENGDPCVRPGRFVLRLTDYIATRVLEVTIHAMDILDAFGLPPAPTSEGMAVTHDILEGLLGADPRELGFTDADFAIAATGRRALTSSERERLGPLAEEFPLLA